MARAAVVLSGCGYLDGAEITEAVSVLISLAQHGVEYTCFAPDMDLREVDHLSGEETGATRNVLTESARIARGSVSPLEDLDVSGFDAVVFPGGFGAAKNLCTFATQGPECDVHPEAKRVLEQAHELGKVIGLACIAPALGARVLGSKGVTVTIGNDQGTVSAVEATGASHTMCAVTEIAEDDPNRVVSTPAYMYGEASPAEVFEGISKMIRSVVERIGD